MRNWNEYYATVGDKPNTALVKVLDTYGATLRKRAALDLGAGNLRDSKFLLHSGFQSVTAVDREKPPGDVPQGVTSIVLPLEQYLPEPNEYDLICSFQTLYFFPEKEASAILARAYRALAEGGVIICNLLADQDDWANKGDRHGYTNEQLLTMLSDIPDKQIRRSTGRHKSTTGQERNADTWVVLIKKQAAQ